ncbi:MAG: hypothetical protein WCE54_01395 [Ignavibacteriaceae bacterium]
MSQVNRETRSTIILFIAILIAVVVTVWIILSFDRPNYQVDKKYQTGFLFNGQKSYNIALQLKDNFI